MQHIRELLNRIESIDSAIEQMQSYLLEYTQPDAELEWHLQIGTKWHERQETVKALKLAVEAL